MKTRTLRQPKLRPPRVKRWDHRKLRYQLDEIDPAALKGSRDPGTERTITEVAPEGPTTQRVRVPPTEVIPEEPITLAFDTTTETKVRPDDGAGPDLKTDEETTSPGAEAVPGTELSPRCEPSRDEQPETNNGERRQGSGEITNNSQRDSKEASRCDTPAATSEPASGEVQVPN